MPSPDKRKHEKEKTSVDAKPQQPNSDAKRSPRPDPRKMANDSSRRRSSNDSQMNRLNRSPMKSLVRSTSKVSDYYGLPQSDLSDMSRSSPPKVTEKTPEKSIPPLVEPLRPAKEEMAEFVVKGKPPEIPRQPEVNRVSKTLDRRPLSNEVAPPPDEDPTFPIEAQVARKGPMCWILMMLVILGAIYLMYQAGPGSLKPDEDDERPILDIHHESSNESLFPKTAKLNTERSFHHTVKRMPACEIAMLSPLDVREGDAVEFTCGHNTSVISDNLVEVQASLIKGLGHLRREDVRLHFKMEANVTFPKDILQRDHPVNFAVMFSALPKNLTFSYSFVDCTRSPQPIRVIHNPLARKVLNEFRLNLISKPDQGELVDRFRCAAATFSQSDEHNQLISFRILADINFAKKEFVLYTCAINTRVCSEAYRAVLPIEVKKIDVKDLRTYFLVARHDDGKKFDWGQKSHVAASTWCELDSRV